MSKTTELSKVSRKVSSAARARFIGARSRSIGAKDRESGLQGLSEQISRLSPIYKPVAVLGVIVTLLASVYGVQRQIDSKAENLPLSESLLLSFPSGDYLKSTMLGFEALAADLIWAHTVVSFGEHFIIGQEHKGLYKLLDMITTLDPLFKEAYLFGGILLAMHAKQVDESMMLLERGIKNCPDDWRFHFIMGFNLTFYKNDNVNAVRYFEDAARLPGHPPYLPRLIGNLYAKTGKIDMALMFLEEAYKQFKNPKMRAEIETQIKELLVEKHTTLLEDAAQKYKRLYGAYPDQLAALAQTTLIPEIPDEPYGGQYVIDPKTGKVTNQPPTPSQNLEGPGSGK